ncbi:hypothetical protein [Actinomadura sp. DC4]|uniref:hypothetical protein n=1 Tax=Actinomadura sp. DC4 TaxID=3055069 RepID=UPI0025B03E3A|nr:hypothetical protein [Actinomadura sp. DC4]MDN3357835.1 hypothetical protein [Actinomadura sp. DC4]
MSARSSIGALALAAAAVFTPLTLTSAPASASAPAVAHLPAITGPQVMARAETWHPHTPQRIPYNQGAYHNGYRTDCSGYASMALGLPAPGTNTVGLASRSVSTPIPLSALATGDLLIDSTGDSNTRHVVIFQRWANPNHSSYWAYEQRGGYGTDHRILTYGLSASSQFHPYHPRVLN